MNALPEQVFPADRICLDATKPMHEGRDFRIAQWRRCELHVGVFGHFEKLVCAFPATGAPAQSRGQDTRAILGELGYGPSEIDTLASSGVALNDTKDV